MNYIKERELIFCHICNEWFKVREKTYLEDEVVKCLECGVILGYIWDWPELFGSAEHNMAIQKIHQLKKEEQNELE